VRASVLGSQGLTDVVLENEEETLSLDAGYVTSALGAVSLAYSF
jgi:hypothetical protein